MSLHLAFGIALLDRFALVSFLSVPHDADFDFDAPIPSIEAKGDCRQSFGFHLSDEGTEFLPMDEEFAWSCFVVLSRRIARLPRRNRCVREVKLVSSNGYERSPENGSSRANGLHF
jgi:hypothetical protein